MRSKWCREGERVEEERKRVACFLAGFEKKGVSQSSH